MNLGVRLIVAVAGLAATFFGAALIYIDADTARVEGVTGTSIAGAVLVAFGLIVFLNAFRSGK